MHKMDTNWGIINCYASFRPGEAGPEPQAPRPAPTNQASASLNARRRGNQAAAARGTSARGRRFCSILAHQGRALSYAAPLPKSAYNRHGLFPDATPPPLLHPASGHSRSWLNQLKKKKEHRHKPAPLQLEHIYEIGTSRRVQCPLARLLVATLGPVAMP